MAFKRIKGMIPETDPRVAQIGHPGPPWMISYADLMTEMVAFFIILYALSASLDKNMQKVDSDVKAQQEQIKKEGHGEIESQMDKDGIKLTMKEQSNKAFFASGQASLTADAMLVIDQIAGILKTSNNLIEVQGHTDNVPVGGTTFPSNWELSTARATSVVRYLIDKHQFDPRRLGAIGYGEFQPATANDTPENRTKNRRVVFFIKTSVLPKEKEGEGKGGPTPPVASPAGAVTPSPAPTLAAKAEAAPMLTASPTASRPTTAPVPAKPAAAPPKPKLDTHKDTLADYPPGILK